MKEKLEFVRLPIFLIVIYFVGRIIMGSALGVDKRTYDLANRVFSMVILQVHVGLLWGAVARRYRGYNLRESVTALVLFAVVSQILIFIATFLSYVAGVNTLFNFPEALNSTQYASFGESVARRTATFITNCVLVAIAATIGWKLGALVPAASPRP